MIPWKTLDKEEQLDEIVNQSYEQACAVFKHSTRCGVSSMVKRQLEHDWQFPEDEVSPYFLDLIAHRRISNLIAERSGIAHQSPQLIVWYKGKPVYEASHSAISYDDLKNRLTAAEVQSG